MTEYEIRLVARLLFYGKLKRAYVRNNHFGIASCVKITQQILRSNRLTVTEVVVRAYGEPVRGKKFGERSVTRGIFRHTVNNLHDALYFAFGQPDAGVNCCYSVMRGKIYIFHSDCIIT